ncbi:hypothetical protein ACFOU2_09765 [Bacillus songklensis]|uniref:Uncharacterized protein n=1 Tax=Bacillus songklensis TaxID=1069116 RepID=A0ABV8B3F9_9BACI
MIGNQVVIVDDRPDWMKKEDDWMACRTRCPLFRKCSTRVGSQCKKFGGDVIPKIRG